MNKLEFNKLVGDNVIPRLIERNIAFESRMLEDDDEFERELVKKVIEEAGEIRDSSDREELIKEIADLVDVVDALRKLNEISDEELAVALATRREKRGGFSKRQYVLWTEDDGYRSNGSTKA